MLTNDMTVNAQWANRPADQRYLTLDDLHCAVSARHRDSHQIGVAMDHVRVTDLGDDMAIIKPYDDGTESGEAYPMTNWAFGQLCQRVGAPAGYLRGLPPAIAASPLQWSIETAEREDGKILVRDFTRGGQIGAFNSGTYGRIWDDELTGACLKHLGSEWQVPAASYAATDAKRATTLYASDRDVFLFLVDPSKQIEIDGETFFRGFYAWNSEVGSATLGLATFLLQRVCDNRIIWGQRDKVETKIRHTSGAPHRFIREATPQLQAYGNAGTGGEVQTIKRAMACEIGKDRESVQKWMQARGFTGSQAKRAYDSAESRGKNPRTVWGLVDGATYIAAEIEHTDQRVDFERAAGKLLTAVE